MTTTLIDEYTGKHLAGITCQDHQNVQRYNQGKVHARQGRADLIGQCPHYDAGYNSTASLKQ